MSTSSLNSILGELSSPQNLFFKLSHYPITVVIEFKGIKRDKYEQIIQALQAKGAAPVGRMFHIASEKPDGVLAIDVWESPEKLQAFAGVLMPIILGLGIAQPEPQVFPTIAGYCRVAHRPRRRESSGGAFTPSR